MDDLKLIKKHYGEDMMHFCRENFSSILETKGKLYEIMSSRFHCEKDLYKDIKANNMLNDYIKFIYSFVKKKDEKKLCTLKSPFELMDEAGYTLYECKTRDEINSFEHYYADGEELCTFYQKNRIELCHVFFAVKKNVDEIKRSNFKHPRRQDEYGTSVISIQFLRGSYNAVSIKNRYNHTVINPDSTFGNDLDNIIEGLEDSFKKYYNFTFETDDYSFDIPGYVRTVDNKIYKYNCELYNIYYCPKNIIIQNHSLIRKYCGKNASQYIVMDYFILDLKERKMFLLDEFIDDSFLDFFKKIKKIDVIKSRKDGTRIIYIELCNKKYCYVIVDKYNRIIGYENRFLTKIRKSFLKDNTSLRYLNLSSVKEIGDDFLSSNTELEYLNIPYVKRIGNYFLKNTKKLRRIDMSKLVSVGSVCLTDCVSLEQFNFKSLKYIGDHFLSNNNKITKVCLPYTIKVGNSFLSKNTCLRILFMPRLVYADFAFLSNNTELKKLYLPNIEVLKPCSLLINSKIKEIYCPKLKEVDYTSILLNNQNRNKLFNSVTEKQKVLRK